MSFLLIAYSTLLYNISTYDAWLTYSTIILNVGYVSKALNVPLYLLSVFGIGFLSINLKPPLSHTDSTTNDTPLHMRLCKHVCMQLPEMIDLVDPKRILIRSVVPKNQILFKSIESLDKHTSKLRDWVLTNEELSTSTTTHWWYDSLPRDIKESYDSVMYAPQIKALFNETFTSRYWTVEPVEQMNEVYVSSPAKNNNSDTVFYMRHIDGPWYYLFPFCKTYRCIFAINENTQITTFFPSIDKQYTLTSGDLVGFDFNRDIHYIKRTDTVSESKPRITLKLHYIVYPTWFTVLGKMSKWASVFYDIGARKLFLFTLTPRTVNQKQASNSILISTHLFYLVENYIGFYNLALFALYLLVSQELCIMMAWIFRYSVYEVINDYEMHEIAIQLVNRNVNVYTLTTYCNLLNYMYHYLLRSSNPIDIITFLLFLFGSCFVAIPLIVFGIRLSLHNYSTGIHRYILLGEALLLGGLQTACLVEYGTLDMVWMIPILLTTTNYIRR